MIDVAHAGEVPPSPCNKVCSIDRRTGWCLGCFRTGEEIGAWPAMTLQAKRDLLALLPARQIATRGGAR